MIIRCIPLNIYKHNGDSSNNGISHRFTEILIEHPDGFIKVDTENPPENWCKVVERELFGRTYRHVEPVQAPEHLGWMYGGCIVDTSDSRGRDVLGSYPLHLHDRQETQEQYNLMFD